MANSSSEYQNATFKLTNDITLTQGQIDIHYSPTIDLNNHFIDGNSTSRIFYVVSSAQLTITDNSSDANGKLYHGVAAGNEGGAIYNAGTFILSNGLLYTCSADKGGGIYVGGNSTLTMTGGTISNNTAARGDRGAGISVNGNLVMSGNPKVYFNTSTFNEDKNDVYLNENKVITVNGAFTEGAEVYVRIHDNYGTITSGYTTYNASADPATVFHHNDSSYAIDLIGNEAFTYQHQWTSGSTTCTFDFATGTFTVSGNGEMANYIASALPDWYSVYRNLITSVVIEEGVTKIGKFAFYQCENLMTITIPSTLTEIRDSAFDYCNNVNNIYIHKNLAAADLTWGSNANSFKANKGTNCYVSPIRVADYETKFGSSVNVTFVATWPLVWDWCNATCTLASNGTFNVSGTGVMCDCDYQYGQNSFPWGEYADYINSVVIESGITYVGKYAFISCNNLESIDFGPTVTIIPERAFAYCPSLETLNIPNNVETIGWNAFSYCSGLKTITIGTGLTYIDFTAFFGCTNVDDLYMNSLTPENIEYRNDDLLPPFKTDGSTLCHVYAHGHRQPAKHIDHHW